MAGLTKEQRAERERLAAETLGEPAAVKRSIIDEVRTASAAALRAGDQAEHAFLEVVLFNLHTLKVRIGDRSHPALDDLSALL